MIRGLAVPSSAGILIGQHNAMMKNRTDATPLQLERLWNDVQGELRADETAHLDDDVLLAYSTDALTADHVALAESHLAACPDCADLLERLMGASAVWDGSEGARRLDALSKRILSVPRKPEDESIAVNPDSLGRELSAEDAQPTIGRFRLIEWMRMSSSPPLAWAGATVFVLGVLTAMLTLRVERSSSVATRSAAESRATDEPALVQPTNQLAPLSGMARTDLLANSGSPVAPVVAVRPTASATTPAAVLTNASRKLRIAVLDFDDATVRSDAAAIFGADIDVGKGISDLLVNYLVKDGGYLVMDRRAVDKILGEQNFSTSDRADPNFAAKIGKLLGVDAILVGSITQLGNFPKNTGGVGGGLSRTIGDPGLNESKVIVGLNAGIVKIDTGEIVAVAFGMGESKRNSTSPTGDVGSWRFGTGDVNFGDSNFQNTSIGEAVKGAVENISAAVISHKSSFEMRAVMVNGLVAAVGGGQIVLNVGSKAGVKVGDRLSVERVSHEIQDPATGKVIPELRTLVGIIRVTQVDAESSYAEMISGAEVRRADVVRKK